jgi:transposase
MGGSEWLSDEAWAVIEPHLPKGRPCARRVDDRRVISGILHVMRSGCRWRDCPAEYGPPTTIYNRYNRWSGQGVWRRIFERLVDRRSYRRRNVIERMFCRMKDWRRIATRYDRLARNFRSAIAIVATACFWLT